MRSACQCSPLGFAHSPPPPSPPPPVPSPSFLSPISHWQVHLPSTPPPAQARRGSSWGGRRNGPHPFLSLHRRSPVLTPDSIIVTAVVEELKSSFRDHRAEDTVSRACVCVRACAGACGRVKESVSGCGYAWCPHAQQCLQRGAESLLAEQERGFRADSVGTGFSLQCGGLAAGARQPGSRGLGAPQLHGGPSCSCLWVAFPVEVHCVCVECQKGPG